MTYPLPVTAELFDKTGTLMGAVDLANAFGIEFFDEYNGPGSGSLSILLSDSAALELTPGRFVNIKVGGTSRFTFKIEGNPRYQLIQQGEESDQMVSVQGRGWGCVFDEAIIYPSAELGARLDHSWNLYSFAHPDFPAANQTSWAAAVELYEFLDGVTADSGRRQLADGNLYPSPINFPWAISPNNYDTASPPGAGYIPTYWIWSEADYPNEEYQLGWCFFRNEITLTADTILTFAVTADNFFTFFVDGVPILGENADVWMWQGWKEVSIFLAGDGGGTTYTLAALAENVGFPGQTGTQTTNPGGFLMAVYEVDGNQTPTTHHLSSDDTWDCEFVGNEDRWPGWTPGQIIAHMITAATTSPRQSLAQYNSDTFTDTLDSNGDAWRPLLTTLDSPYLSTAFDVGSTVMEALTQMHEDGWINWHVQPGTLILDVIRGREPTPSSSATFTAGSNIVSLERAETEKYANELLVQWEQGFVVVSNGTAITAHGSAVEDIFSSDAPSSEEAGEHGENELLRRANEGLPAIAMQIEPTSTSDAPYEGFDLLDYVTIPAVGGGTEIVKVLSVKCNQDSEGFASWSLELNRKLRVPEREQIDLLRQIGGRSQIVRGRVS